MKNIILLSLLSISVLGACNKKTTQTTQVKENVEKLKQINNSQQLYYSNYAGDEKPSQKVINDDFGFSVEWDKITSKSSPSPKKPTIDFDKNSIIVIHFGQVNHGVNKQQLKEIKKKGNEYEIILFSEAPDPNGLYTMEISNPVMVIVTDKIEGTPQIKLIHENK